ncbi:unnamed protein product [Symbiodinium necroappetens]|uniref:Uncharacterized protein n=1 Tax=Symbiodinium necroappetens TaxID=1628268 RepID=A0A813CG53_9DINO|nr:unnamed protein product [Symbiodinium necroappetens]
MESDAHSVRVVLTAVAPPPPHPHLSELLPREHRQVHREPSRDPPEDLGDALLGRHSKLYQRRKEVEAELKQEFSLPEEATAVLHELRSRRSTPLGYPPPVPKPRVGKSKLPPIPKLPEQHRPPRWGVGDASENIATAQDQADAQTPWWKLEQEILARRSSDRQLTAEHVDQRDQADEAGEDFTTFDRTLQKRPQSWRMGRPDQLRSRGENVSVLDVFAVLYGDMCRKSRQVLQHWRTARQHPSEHSKDSKSRCMGRGQTLQDDNPPTKNEETHR